MCEGAGVWKNKRKLTALRLGLLLCALPHGEKPIKRRPSQAPTVPYKRPQRKPHDHYTTVTRPFHDRYTPDPLKHWIFLGFGQALSVKR